MELRKGEFWDNYYTLITSRCEPAEIILAGNEIPYISMNNSQVLYNAVPDLVSIPLSDLPKRFDEKDPRFDPYLRGLSSLFEGTVDNEKRELIYIAKEGRSPFALYSLLNEAYGETSDVFFLGGFNPWSFILPAFLYLLSLTVFVLFFRNRRFLTIVCGLSWLPFVFLFGFEAAITAMALNYLLALGKGRIVVSLAAAAIAFFLELSSSPSSPHLFLLMLFLGFSGSLVSALFWGDEQVVIKPQKGKKRKIRFSKPEHQLFEPVSIMGKQKAVAPVARLHGWSTAAVLLFVSVGFFLSASSLGQQQAVLPLPVQMDGVEWTLGDVERTFEKGRIVSAGDYLAHRAFQEGFLYRSEWRYPSPSVPLLYPVYETEDKTISKSYEIIADYNEKWFRNQISLLKNNNPAKLLFSTKGPSVVEKKQDQSISAGFSLLHISHFMLVLLLLYLGSRKNTTNTSFSVRKKLLRRNEQVA